MSLVHEFYTTDELCMLVGSRRNATVRAILDAHGIAYLVRRDKWPLVARGKLYPGASEAPRRPFDFSAART